MALEFRAHTEIATLGQAAWDALATGTFPFHEYDFLHALEASGSVGEGTGWQPLYLSAWDSERLVGATYLYVKGHSYGEFVFDWEWAHAYASHGVAYYPKLVSMIPLTPATGPRWLIAPDAPAGIAAGLADATLAFARQLGVSSTHFLFLSESERAQLESRGLSIRQGYQFHWHNRGYADYEAFLAEFKSRKRKAIRHERRQANQSGVRIEVLTGDALTAEHADAMAAFYARTTDKRGGQAYLTPDFFARTFATMRDRILFVLASDEHGPVAAALNFYRGKNLYGRYWGTTDEHRFLHFELCYHRPIEWAIAHGIQLFEAGAQGEHKIQRGFLPTKIYSAHHLEHPAFRAAIDRFLVKEREYLDKALVDWEPELPFRAPDSAV